MKKLAKNLNVGDQYKSGSTIQVVSKIIKVTKKTIEFRTNRISPDPYPGGFYQRKSLTTLVEVIKSKSKSKS